MPASDDRWNVVVVGLRDPSSAGQMVTVAELAHYVSLPQDVLGRKLSNDGEVEVLANLDRAEAERAAQELHELGGLVDLRLAEGNEDGVFPVLKPDSERTVGVAVGGLIDDSATPPSMGEVRGALPEVEPDLEPTLSRSRSSRMPGSEPGLGGGLGGGLEDLVPISTRPDFDGVPELAGPEHDMRRAADPSELEMPEADLPPLSLDGGTGAEGLPPQVGPPGLGEEPLPPPRPRASRPPKSGGSHERDGASAKAGAKGDGRSKGRAGGKPGREAGAKPNKPKRGAAPSLAPTIDEAGPVAPAAKPKLPQRLQAAKAAAQEQGALELDFEAVGLARPPTKGVSAAPSPVEDEGSGLAAEREPSAGQSRVGAGDSVVARPAASGPSAARALLRNDTVSAVVLGLCAGLVLSLIVALVIQRSAVRERLPPLENELAEALADPAGVEAERVRAPQVIENELDDALDEMERSFLLWWLGLGIPAGLLLSNLRKL